MEVTPMDRVRWARLIAQRRAQQRPVAWPKIAKETGLSVDACQRLHAQLIRSGDPDAPADAWAWVYERRDVLRVVMDEAARTYAAAPPGTAAAVGALKLLEQTSDRLLELARWVGWTPRQLGALNAEQAMQELFREMAAIAEQYNAPTEMIEAFLELAERRLSGPRTIDASASPA